MATTLNSQPGAQLGGLDRVFFVDHDLVATWPRAIGGQLLSAHTLKSGQSFAELVSTFSTPALSTDATDTQHGGQYQQLLEGIYSGDDPLVSSQIGQMVGRRYLVIAAFRNGTMVAAGNRLSGLLFTAKRTTGSAAKERTGWAWKFESPTSTPAAYLTKPFTVQGIGLVTPGLPIPTQTGGSSGTVAVYNNGRLVGYARPGQQVDITTIFRALVTIK